MGKLLIDTIRRRQGRLIRGKGARVSQFGARIVCLASQTHPLTRPDYSYYIVLRLTTYSTSTSTACMTTDTALWLGAFRHSVWRRLPVLLQRRSCSGSASSKGQQRNPSARYCIRGNTCRNAPEASRARSYGLVPATSAAAPAKNGKSGRANIELQYCIDITSAPPDKVIGPLYY